MKQEQKLTELLEVWDNKDKAQAIKVLKASMAESKSVKVGTTEVKRYVKHAIQEGLGGNSLPDYPSDFSSASRSIYYKQAIETAVKEIEEALSIDNSSEILEIAWKNCKEASTLVDFRKNLKLYLVALRTELCTPEDVAWYVGEIERLEDEAKRLKEFERVCNEIFGVLQQNNPDLELYRKYKVLKEGNLSDTEISTILDTSRPKLNKLLKNFQSEL